MMDKTDAPSKSLYPANFCDIKNQSLSSDRKEASNNHDKGFDWIGIKEKQLTQLILDTFVNPQKKKIMDLTSDKALTVPEILEICKMPTTSGYRTINSLIKNGLLVKSSENIENGRRINKYKSIFENIMIKIEKHKVSVNAKLAI